MISLLFSIALLLPGLHAEAPKPAVKASAPAASDTQIEAAIRARFAASKISRNHFQVAVKSGVATLTGSTDIVQHKGAATRLAKIAGAKAVNNQIQISDAARQKASQSLARARKATVKQP